MKLEKVRFAQPVELEAGSWSPDWNPVAMPGTTMHREGADLVLRDSSGAMLAIMPFCQALAVYPAKEPPPVKAAQPGETKLKPAKKSAGKRKR